MIDWANLTLKEHDAAKDALLSVSDDILTQVKDDIETGGDNRLIDACFMIGKEINRAIADLARREADMQDRAGVARP